MQARSSDFLATANEHRAIAQAVLAAELRPRAYQWVAVIAFYAAVHYVNAYLWEKRQIEPRDHTERLLLVSMSADLRAANQAYDRLQNVAYRARYVPRFRLAHQEAARLVAQDLADVRQAVLVALAET